MRAERPRRGLGARSKGRAGAGWEASEQSATFPHRLESLWGGPGRQASLQACSRVPLWATFTPFASRTPSGPRTAAHDLTPPLGDGCGRGRGSGLFTAGAPSFAPAALNKTRPRAAPSPCNPAACAPPPRRSMPKHPTLRRADEPSLHFVTGKV